MKMCIGGALASVVLAAWLPPVAQAQGFSVLYSFQGGDDGANPQTVLVRDKAGDLYGTTVRGGHKSQCDSGCGTVFRLAPDGTESVLYAMKTTSGSAFPNGALNLDRRGNLYGGGAAGAVFELGADGKLDVLHDFIDVLDGPYGGLIEGPSGAHYGTIPFGGTQTGGCPYGCGMVYEVTKKGAVNIIYSFGGDQSGAGDGQEPLVAPIMDAAGNLYGTTNEGGTGGCGTVYKIAAGGTETVLHSFGCGSDGAYPGSSLILDSDGDLYGTTEDGGNASCQYGCGTVFELAPDGTFSVLYAFTGSDGALPARNLVRDGKDIYGTTSGGGASSNCYAGCGTVFAIDLHGAEAVLHSFSGSDGSFPFGLLRAPGGMLYGATTEGGTAGDGVIYEVAPFK
ncbi:MAG TPA: choice-of-anchor tandem repeat GloVer-containing protein [Rhizomicrobium sp.]|jgi:uncharacterized repeat protein (TIGR03803 family)|nr:choice-of-anchor tandem repeat GloVer-containing protein [Rhizomicrobium sp.]